MRLVIHLGKMLKIQMRINLRGADVGMAEQFLHGAQVTAGFQQVTSEGVA